MSPRILLAAAVLAATPACTVLGPMPATTGVSAVPVGRPGVEVQAGVMPASWLSDAARQRSADAPEPTSAGVPQLSGLYEGARGLIIGARTWGGDADQPVEPMIGMRRALDEHFAVAGIAYGTFAHGENDGASYAATRAGGEFAIDVNVLPIASWLGLHVQASVSATYLDATGTYCVTSTGDATDCDETTRRVDAAVSGIYGAATAGFSVDVARRPHGWLHDVRLAVLTSYGSQPRIHDGVQQPSIDRFHSIGASLTIGFGDD